MRHARTIAALALLAPLAACGSRAGLPSTFETTSVSTIGKQKLWTVRDIGTGCEIIVTEHGVLPRNERSADGASVKQRCVLTGGETTAPPVTNTTLPAAASGGFTATRPDAVGTNAQDQAVRDAMRDMGAGAPTIPPPTGARPARQRNQPQTPPPSKPAGGGLASQLRQ